MSDAKRKLWAGIVEDKIDWIDVDMGFGGFGTGDRVYVPAIFKSRKEARRRYQCVRPVSLPTVCKDER